MNKLLKKFKHKIKLLFARLTAKIKSGPLKDYRITLLSGIGFIQGNYELEKTETIKFYYPHIGITMIS
jgi:hypothetical protein